MLANETDKAYKRGVVLGLTLAELLILFVFCLLLLIASWAGRALDAKIVEAKSPATEQAWELIRREMAQLREGKSIDELWRELKWAYHEANREGRASTSARSDESTRARVLAELERMRGMERLEDTWRELKWAREEAGRQTAINKDLVKEVQELKERLARAEAALAQAEKPGQGPGQSTESRPGHTWPPIISLGEDTKDYSFERGEARLSKAFEERLRAKVIDDILRYIKEYNVDIIEVVGHTDETHIAGRQSNLDAMLIPFLSGDRRQVALVAADNAGLGLARAASVARFLMSDPRLKDRRYRILPLSSAQALDTNGRLAVAAAPRDTPARRRIEIRLRSSRE